ncbi:hypothetical protein GS458_3132 [Geobacillus stearothermophilus]|nr:hypothetical protein GS458_3132 [Geobacillus stearothermophilus]
MNDGALVSLGSASMILHYAGKPNGKSHSYSILRILGHHHNVCLIEKQGFSRFTEKRMRTRMIQESYTFRSAECQPA